MIRALYEKLDIPPALLVREPTAKYAMNADCDEADIPLDLLLQRGWIEAGITAEQLLPEAWSTGSRNLLDSPHERYSDLQRMKSDRI